MARGQEAKNYVAKKLAEAFGVDYIGEVDKKYYIWSKENGERVQVAISMTCPKVPVETSGYIQVGDWNFEDDATGNAVITTANVPSAPVEISAEERQNIADLMARLGL